MLMTVLEEIEQQLRQLPPDKQSEVLDFITLLLDGTLACEYNVITPAGLRGR